jgi:secretion/DNA translocation related TadE-like protein
LAIGLAAALVLCLMAVATIGAAVVAHNRAVTAADLAALSGAQALIDGLDPDQACQTASRTAAASGAQLISCDQTTNRHLEVRCSVPTGLGHFGIPTATAKAEAGPP